jgi:hypothetical protein
MEPGRRQSSGFTSVLEAMRHGSGLDMSADAVRKDEIVTALPGLVGSFAFGLLGRLLPLKGLSGDRGQRDRPAARGCLRLSELPAFNATTRQRPANGQRARREIDVWPG